MHSTAGSAIRTSPRRIALAFVSALAATLTMAAAAPAAHAGLLVESVGPCEGQTIERPFKRWGDYAPYTLAPNGNLEQGAKGWTLNGASVVAGNETYYVGGANDSRSLSLPAGSSATAQPMCVGLEHPTLRFFARESGGLGASLLSTLRVDALVETSLGETVAVPTGLVVGSGSWQPTPAYVAVADLLPLLPGEHTAVAFRFVPQGSASWRVDDVYVDPRMR